MQTFLPYPDIEKSISILDYRRLGKQRIEAMQIRNILLGKTNKPGWQNHPAVLMWKHYENALTEYMNFCIVHWVSRGYNNNMELKPVIEPIEMPPWFGFKPFHDAHRSNLLRKDPKYYAQFNWKVPTNLPYIWPTRKDDL